MIIHNLKLFGWCIKNYFLTLNYYKTTLEEKREKLDFVDTNGVRLMKTKEKKSEVNMSTSLNVFSSIILIKIKVT